MNPPEGMTKAKMFFHFLWWIQSKKDIGSLPDRIKRSLWKVSSIENVISSEAPWRIENLLTWPIEITDEEFDELYQEFLNDTWH